MRDERLRRGLLLSSALAGGFVFVAFVLWERPGLGIGHFYYVCIILAALATGPKSARPRRRSRRGCSRRDC
jgi:hypothetical protein